MASFEKKMSIAVKLFMKLETIMHKIVGLKFKFKIFES